MSSKLVITKKGRPTKYSRRILKCVMHYTRGCIKDNEFPTIEGLAISLGLGTRTLYDWENIYPEFSQTMDSLRDTQRHLLLANGLKNKYNPSFASFLLKAIHGFSDSKPIFEATQNNYMNISPDVLAEALDIVRGNKQLPIRSESNIASVSKLA